MSTLALAAPISETAAQQPNRGFKGHNDCVTLSHLVRGAVCEAFARKNRSQHLNSGEFVYQAQDAGQSVFLLRRGLVKTVVSSRAGRELILRIHKPGDIFGELCFCSGKRREYAVAMEASECVEIPFDKLLAHLQGNPQALSDFLGTICERLSSAYEDLSSFSFERTEHRLIRTLLKLAGEFGQASPEGKIIGHYIKQEELAAMIGAPREMVSSLLKQLRQKQLITYSRRGHLTVDTTALLAYMRLSARKK